MALPVLQRGHAHPPRQERRTPFLRRKMRDWRSHPGSSLVENPRDFLLAWAAYRCLLVRAALRHGGVTDTVGSRTICVAHRLGVLQTWECARLIDQILADLNAAKEGVSRNQWLTRQHRARWSERGCCRTSRPRASGARRWLSSEGVRRKDVDQSS